MEKLSCSRAELVHSCWETEKITSGVEVAESGGQETKARTGKQVTSLLGTDG